MGESSKQGSDPQAAKDIFVEVVISTTAGLFPHEGRDKVPAHQKVSVELAKAKEKLKIKNTTGWIATVNEPSGRRVIAPESSYIENHLTGRCDIDWGPSEGGGG